VTKKNAPATSAKAHRKRDNLLTIFAFIDAHPSLSQGAVVEHFKTSTTALLFTQSTLSRKVKDRASLERLLRWSLMMMTTTTGWHN
jgi:hypothetical protein